jgi:hypothetical protein
MTSSANITFHTTVITQKDNKNEHWYQFQRAVACMHRSSILERTVQAFFCSVWARINTREMHVSINCCYSVTWIRRLKYNNVVDYGCWVPKKLKLRRDNSKVYRSWNIHGVGGNFNLSPAVYSCHSCTTRNAQNIDDAGVLRYATLIHIFMGFYAVDFPYL